MARVNYDIVHVHLCDVVQQCIDKSAIVVRWRGVNDHARRLVDRDEVRVLEQDIERDGLSHGRQLPRRP